MNSNNFFSSPDLLLWIFNFLPFDCIKSLGQVNKVLNSLYKNMINRANIGIFATYIWFNHIKTFQRVNQALRAMTLSKPLSEVMLRSDISTSKLKEIRVGVKLSKERYEVDRKGHMIRILHSGIHPFFGAISYSLGEP